MQCPKCHTVNEDSSRFCISCGTQLIAEAPKKSLLDYYRAAIGDRQDYYLPRFGKFHKNKKAGISWHWPAFFFTLPWMVYRKMWIPALLYGFSCTAVFIALLILAVFSGQSGGAVFGVGILLMVLAVFFLPALFANALYYRKINNLIRETEKLPFPPERQVDILFERGGTLRSGLFIVIILVLVFPAIWVLGVMAAVAIPAYQDYTLRTKVSNALELGETAAQMVGDYHAEHGDLPDSLEAAGFSPYRLPITIQSIELDAVHEIIVITMAEKPIEGHAFYLQLLLDNDDKIVWTCHSADLHNRYLPKECWEQQ